MKVLGLTAIMICALFLMGTQVQATVLLDDNFESYSAPLELISVTAPSSPTGEQYYYDGPGGWTKAAVVATGGNGGQAIGPNAEGSKYDIGTIPLGTTVTAASAENIVNFSVDLKLGSYSESQSSFRLTNNGAWPYAMDAYLAYAPDWELVGGNWVQLGPHSKLVVDVFGVNFITEYDIEDFDWMTVSGSINLGTGETTIGFDNGTQSGGNTFTIATSDINAVMLGVQTAPDEVDTGQRVDNVFIEVTPEPATMSLLVLGAVGLIRRRRA